MIENMISVIKTYLLSRSNQFPLAETSLEDSDLAGEIPSAPIEAI